MTETDDEQASVRGPKRWKVIGGAVVWPCIGWLVFLHGFFSYLAIALLDGYAFVRRRRGDHDATPLADSLQLVWIPTITMLGSVALAFGFQGRHEPYGWTLIAGSVAAVAVLSARLARDFGDHVTGRNVAVWDAHVSPAQAITQISRFRRESKTVLLPGVYLQGRAQGHLRVNEVPCTQLAGGDPRSPAPRPLSNVLAATGSAVNSLARTRPVFLFFAVVLGLLTSWHGACAEDWSSRLVLIALGVSAVLGLPVLAIATFADAEARAFLLGARERVLEKAAAQERADQDQADQEHAERERTDWERLKELIGPGGRDDDEMRSASFHLKGLLRSIRAKHE